MSKATEKKPVGFATHIVAGGLAGAMEALCCQPLDTIKVRMQLSKSGSAPGTKARGFIATGVSIVQRETPLALYKGLGAVLSGIVPKMAIRFASFETYKKWLADKETGKTGVAGIFFAGLAAGTTEAVAVVTPMEVVKIRLQAQSHSLADPLEAPRYRNAAHAVYTIVREEGCRTLYRGVSLTALRQATNQGQPSKRNKRCANFTAYQELKKQAHKFQPDLVNLPSYQHMVIGLVSGAMGPFSNAPIDTIKTRLQKSAAAEGETAWTRITVIAREMWRQEGVRSFYKGITPRVLRVAPGQAIVFAVYERVRRIIENMKETTTDDSYSE
ncbi:mitochondrial carrier [Ramaria rubella]|nr:mitochondrial carrier [Ramaria rubella]